MFLISILVLFYSYIIFIIGIADLLYKEVVAGVSILFVGLSITVFRTKIRTNIEILVKDLKQSTKFEFAILLLIITTVLINFIGVLSPETAFDALWYHLTLPKLYLQNNSVFFVPGGLFYYSVMPKLGEMLYVGALSIGPEQLAKFIHFLFGTASVFVLYKLSRLFFQRPFALLTCLVYYANLVVAWLSTTAYIDLIRTFYEILALYAFLKYYTHKQKNWLYVSAVMVGCAITTKLLAFSTLVLFIALFIITFYKSLSLKQLFQKLSLFIGISLLIPLPWLIFSYSTTGNPVYPFFSNIYPISPTTISVQRIVTDLLNLLIRSADPISPIYLIILPFAIARFSTFKPMLKIVVYYCFLALILWYFTPRTGGGRFILPYLPALSLAVVGVLSTIKDRYIYKSIIGVIFLVAVVTIVCRGVATARYISVILGFETKNSFLSRELNFEFGDYYDIDGKITTFVKPSDTVLFIGGHNLYYTDFRVIHESFRKKSDMFSYVIIQNANLPEEFGKWKNVYHNKETKVTLYKKP